MKHILLFNDGDKTGYFLTAGNEAMKPIFLLFNGFHKTEIFQFTFSPIKDGRREEVQKGSLLVSLNTFNFNLFPHRYKISRPYLVLVSNY